MTEKTSLFHAFDRVVVVGYHSNDVYEHAGIITSMHPDGTANITAFPDHGAVALLKNVPHFEKEVGTPTHESPMFVSTAEFLEHTKAVDAAAAKADAQQKRADARSTKAGVE
jgi:hypothetical protein